MNVNYPRENIFFFCENNLTFTHYSLNKNEEIRSSGFQPVILCPGGR